MTEKQEKNWENIDEMLSTLAEIDESLNLMHYDPEAVPENQAEEVEKLLQALQYANRLAKQLSEYCEY